MQCASAADDPNASGDERDRLLTMRKALLELAEAQDWLDGKKRDPAPIKQSPVIKIPA